MIRSASKMTATAALLAVVLLATTSSQAAFKLFIDDLGDAAPGITITDQDFGGAPPDQDGTLGLIYFDGAVGNFDVVLSNVVSKPLLGPPDSIDFLSLAVSGPNTGTLLLRATDTGFTDINPGNVDFEGSIAGGTDGSVIARAFADTNNTEFGGVLVGTMGPIVLPSFNETMSATAGPFLAPYSMTLEATITHDDPNDFTSFDFLFAAESSLADTGVPEPATWLLGSMALLGMLLGVRRRVC